jgi:hypothetical protein
VVDVENDGFVVANFKDYYGDFETTWARELSTALSLAIVVRIDTESRAKR